MKPIHAVVAGVFALFWIGLLAYVLTHGKDQGSGVDVYSELPPGFTAALQTKGVTFSGLSPVDGATVDQVLSHATDVAGASAPVDGATVDQVLSHATDVAGASGADPIVLRTAFSDSVQGGDFQDRAALMVVVPQSQASNGSVHVAFLDPTTYTTLTSVTYADAGG
jgi:hypothetical protein